MDWGSKVTEKQLYDWLKQELGELPKVIKDALKEEYIDAVLQAWHDQGEHGQESEAYTLLGVAKKYLGLYQDGAKSRAVSTAPVYKAGQGEQEAYDALTHYYEGEINARADIRNFRKRMDRCGLAFPCEYHGFLERDLFRILSFEKLEQVIVKPFTPADYHVMPGGASALENALSVENPLIPSLLSLQFRIWRKTDNNDWDVEHDPRNLMYLQREEAVCTNYEDAVYVKGAAYRGHFWENRGHSKEIAPENAQHSLWLTAEEVLRQHVFRLGHAEALTFQGTVVWEALQIGADVSRDYGLPVEDVLSVLLTGHVRPHSVIQSQVISCPVRLLPEGGKVNPQDALLEYHAVSRISIEVPAWISPASVAAHVKELQQYIYGNAAYLPKPEHLKLFRFVNDQHADLPEGEKSRGWGALHKLWGNCSGQSDLQPKDRRNFALVYSRVRDKLLPQPPALKKLAWPPSQKTGRKKVSEEQE